MSTNSIVYRVKIAKKEAVLLYWLLEAYENLWSFTTDSTPKEEVERSVIISTHPSQSSESRRVLKSILSELKSASLEKV